MSNWFDDRARAAAQRDAEVSAAPKVGISRRRMLQRTAVVGGAAWVAPTLLSAAPAWAASCTNGGTACGSDCCTSAQYCGIGIGGLSVCLGRTGLSSICVTSATCQTQYACSGALCKIPTGSTLSCTLDIQCVSGNCNGQQNRCVSNRAGAGVAVDGQVDGGVSANSVPQAGSSTSSAPTTSSSPTTSSAPTSSSPTSASSAPTTSSTTTTTASSTTTGK